MLITTDSRSPQESRTDLLVVPIGVLGDGEQRLPARLARLDRLLGGDIAAAVASGDFRGKKDQKLLLYPNGSLPAKRVLVLGLGPENAIDTDAIRRVGGTAVREASARKAAKLTISAPRTPRRMKAAAMAQALAEGAVLGSYRFDAYQQKPEDPPGKVSAVQISFDRDGDVRAARQGAKRGAILAESQNLARDLSNAPGNELPPAALAREARKVAKEVGLKVRVLGVPELEKRKMGAILAVGGGSANPPRLIVLEHQPARAKKNARPLCFVGKGVTFDSGGISIKPSAGMDEMKHDMSGAATVVGALRACALLKVPHPVVGIIGAAENLPSATAYRPGDVVTSASGKTIEVLNTDAEGRVVLADALHFACTEFKPSAIVDLATLTGACVVALGRWASGLFANNEQLAERLRQAGDAVGELAWPLPLLEGHHKAVKSPVADIKNTGAGREAGPSTAAAFLAAFVGETPWAHLDIAGTAWTTHVAPTQPRGATGVGVRLLLELLEHWKEAKL
ncbi:MAG: leucyl aminopeptidase [Deltaproteobacteria bacterium]|nr:leucyl aminopeptidase [Deltaproteobacteria bacterium]MBW2362923.1 leucyl aminopeptidase [Deltaproteobacteria bacterium]